MPGTARPPLPDRRVILLGASNIAFGFPTAISAAQAAWGRPLASYELIQALHVLLADPEGASEAWRRGEDPLEPALTHDAEEIERRLGGRVVPRDDEA